jgi:hypothetical protein
MISKVRGLSHFRFPYMEQNRATPITIHKLQEGLGLHSTRTRRLTGGQ